MGRMHELSIMSQVVESITRELEGKPVTGVESVRLEVGELTMLGRDQMAFAWGVLTGKNILKGARLIIVNKPAVVECKKCGFCGRPKKSGGPGDHFRIPSIFCPKCGGDVRIVGGRECVLRSLRAKVDVVGGPGAAKGGKRHARD